MLVSIRKVFGRKKKLRMTNVKAGIENINRQNSDMNTSANMQH